MYKFYARTDDKVKQSENLADIMDSWKEEERWLFVAPHDDDIVLGGGLLLQKAVEMGIPVCMLITSDGQMGYCQAEHQDTIHEVRAAETRESFNMVGVDDVRWLNFPDCSLAQHGGRRRAQAGDPCVIAGFTGLQNAYTHEIRKFQPTRVFVPSGSDYHPDHKTVYEELLISIFHSGGDIWPELGAPLKALPKVYEMAIYCDFPERPNIKIEAPQAVFEKKLESILAYRSQTQIEKLVDNVRASGPIEFYRELTFKLYQPQDYVGDFE